MDPLSAEQQLAEAGRFLLRRTARRPTVGIILGSGLAGLAEEVAEAEAIPWAEIPHHARPTVAGHRGVLVLGEMTGRAVAVLQGRLHYYEGYSMWQVTFPVRLMRALGVETLIVTNAAGGLNPHFRSCDLMLISDHINMPGLAGANPLYGLAEDHFGPRFVSLGQAYDPGLYKLAWAVGGKLGLPLHSGVYAMVAGPSYETPAELRMLRALGADAVGMSTASEVIVAVQVGMRVLGISAITNQATAAGHAALSHEEVLARGRTIEPRLGALIKGVIAALPAPSSAS